VLDASGRDTFLGHKLKIKHNNKKHNSTALYAHFSGVQRNDGKQAGDITIFWFAHGWFWLIPLNKGLTSIGAVTWPYYLKTRGQQPLDAFLQATIALCPPLAQRLASAGQQTAAEATGNFSYACERTHGDNYLLLGDAFAFIDPVFSSGVMLAMQNAFDGADTVDTCLRQPRQSAVALRQFDQRVRHGPKLFSWFIYRVTNPTMRDMFMNPGNPFRVKEALLSLLAGDIYGSTPTGRSIVMFKLIYYIGSLVTLKRTFQAWRKHKHQIRPTPDVLTTVP
jgi:flavin-dependent dehydrogenase